MRYYGNSWKGNQDIAKTLSEWAMFNDIICMFSRIINNREVLNPHRCLTQGDILHKIHQIYIQDPKVRLREWDDAYISVHANFNKLKRRMLRFGLLQHCPRPNMK
jgi:hypothetical protein